MWVRITRDSCFITSQMQTDSKNLKYENLRFYSNDIVHNINYVQVFR